MVPKFRPFDLLVSVAHSWRWLWSIGGILPTW